MENKGFKKAGIRQWVSEHPGLNSQEKQRIIDDNEKAVENTKRLKLPMDIAFGSFDSIEQMTTGVPEEFRNNCLFIIRCPHRSKQIIQRKLFVPWVDVVQFVKDLPEGYEQYRLGLREVSQPVWSGTIVSSKGGDSVLVELWKGKHLEMDDGNKDTSYRGVFNDDPTCHRRFIWSENCTDELKEMMLNALRYFARDLRPKESFSAEFSITTKGYRFHGVSFDPYWNSDSMKPKTLFELSGRDPLFLSWGD